jgi:hypothetical protein
VLMGLVTAGEKVFARADPQEPPGAA